MNERLESMKCKNCGSSDLIKAHLIPRAFCFEVQNGKSHAVANAGRDAFKIIQSGLWDKGILCSGCDGKLGAYEQYVHKIGQEIRRSGSDTAWKTKIVLGVDNVKVLRFCAGILYKYSLTSKINGQITLGMYQEVLRSFIFDQRSDVPAELDAFVVRPLRYIDDREVFAYRAPLSDRKHGVNIYRMMMGGLIFFVRLDKRPITDIPPEMMMKDCAEGLPFTTVDASQFEEFTMPREMVLINENLSAYLDKNA